MAGFEGCYSVSSCGAVRNDKTAMALKPHKDKDGYQTIGLSKGGKQYVLKVHRIVALAFIENAYGLPCIDHINGVRDDNRVENLRWCTVKDNNGYELARKRKCAALSGKRKSEIAIAHNRVAQHKRKVFQYDLSGNLVREWDGLRAMERETGFARVNVVKCARGKYNQAYGYIWSFENLGAMNKSVVRHRSPVRQIDVDGNLVNVWPSMTAAAKHYGVTETAIFNCVSGKTKMCKGFIWRKSL